MKYAVVIDRDGRTEVLKIFTDLYMAYRWSMVRTWRYVIDVPNNTKVGESWEHGYREWNDSIYVEDPGYPVPGEKLWFAIITKDGKVKAMSSTIQGAVAQSGKSTRIVYVDHKVKKGDTIPADGFTIQPPSPDSPQLNHTANVTYRNNK